MNALTATLLILQQTAVSLVRNWNVVLRLALIPLILPIAVMFAVIVFASAGSPRPAAEALRQDGTIVIIALAAFVALIGSYWVAVGWHRFDILGERPRGFLPGGGGRVLPYLGRVLLVGLLTGLGFFVAGLIFAVAGDYSPTGFRFEFGSLPQPPTAKNVILTTVLFSVVMAGILRVSMVMPAAAIGRNMTFNESSRSMDRLPNWTPLVLSVVLHVLSILVGQITAEIGSGGLGQLLLWPFVSLFWFMFGVALLTRLYGVCVIGRPLFPDTASA